MKPHKKSRDTGVASMWAALLIAAIALVPILAFATAPAWWTSRGVLQANVQPNDYGSVNQGQLKNIAKAAAAELDVELPGGAGAKVHTLVNEWAVARLNTNDFAMVNLGQVKAVAQPFYDRLIAVGHTSAYPWANSPAAARDFEAANVGQVKQLFAFDVTATDPDHDIDGNGIPDWWERYYFHATGLDPSADPDGDGIITRDEFLHHTDPTDRYNGQPPQNTFEVSPARVSAQLGHLQHQTQNLTLLNRTANPVQFSVALESEQVPNYAIADSKTGRVPVQWQEISETGTHLDAVSNADDDFEEVAFTSFTFPFYGESYASLFVGSNGLITFGEGSDNFWNFPLPSPDVPAATIAALWDDLHLGRGGDVYFKEESDRVIVEFQNASRYDRDGVFTFEVVLFSNGVIELRYLSIQGVSNRCTVGAQGPNGNTVEAAFKEDYLTSNMAIRITPTSGFVKVAPTEGFVPPNGRVQLTTIFFAYNLPFGTYDADIVVSHNAATAASPIRVPAHLEVVHLPAALYFTTPADRVDFWEGQNLAIAAAVSDPDQTISRVEFYAGSTLLGVGVFHAGEFRLTWQNIPTGGTVLTARAIDSSGTAVLSTSLTVTGHPDIDADGDGLRSSDEEAAGTSDSNPDTDGDGLTDGEEIARGTDPHKADTDNDGVDDKNDGWPLHKQISSPVAPEYRYAAIKLGPGDAHAVNNLGQVVGRSFPSNTNNPNQAVLWEVGVDPVYLPYLTNLVIDQVTSSADAINDDGIIAGFSQYSWDPTVSGDFGDPSAPNRVENGDDLTRGRSRASNEHACVWDDSGAAIDLHDLSLHQGSNSNSPSAADKGYSRASAINQAGVVVGTSTSNITVVNAGYAWLLYAGENTAVVFGSDAAGPGSLNVSHGPQTSSTARGVNDVGAIVGAGGGADGTYAFFRSAAGGIQLIDGGVQPNGVRFRALANAVNNLHHVVGNFGAHGSASVWVNAGDPADRYVDLTTLPGPNLSSPTVLAINDHDQMVGSHGFVSPDAVMWQNGGASLLASLVGGLDPGRHLLKASAISRYGLIAANGDDGFAYLLAPVELMVDGNRDGEMSFEDGATHNSDLTSSARPYRFWINDDDDTEQNINEIGGGATETERIPAPRPDSGLHQIISKRNLEDFSRIWINLQGIADKVKSGDLEVGLRWKDVSSGTTPAVNIYPSADPEGSDSYLKSDTNEDPAAQNQISGDFGKAIVDKFMQNTVSSTSTFVFEKNFWAGLTPENPKKCFLFEGVVEGKGRLEVVLIDKNHNQFPGGGVWLDLKNIKKMYERADSATEHRWTANQFQADSADSHRDLIVFVHGWRMSPQAAENYSETFYKRLWHRGYKGHVAAFHWDTWWDDSFTWLPYAGGTIDAYLSHYNDSEHVAWQAAIALKNFVEGLSYEHKNIAAHSMGNIVASEAIQLGMHIDNYALMQAAVPAACYDTSAAILQRTQYVLKGITVWDNQTPDDDLGTYTRSKAYRSRFASLTGNLTSFFLELDYATFVPWEINNDISKPPNGPFRANFQYDRNALDGFKLFKYSAVDPVTFAYIIDHYLEDPYESMPFACRTWGKALGAFGSTHGSVDNRVDLGDDGFHLPGQPNGFGDQHSGQFDYGIQSLGGFYDALINSLRLETN